MMSLRRSRVAWVSFRTGILCRRESGFGLLGGFLDGLVDHVVDDLAHPDDPARRLVRTVVLVEAEPPSIEAVFGDDSVFAASRPGCATFCSGTSAGNVAGAFRRARFEVRRIRSCRRPGHSCEPPEDGGQHLVVALRRLCPASSISENFERQLEIGPARRTGCQHQTVAFRRPTAASPRLARSEFIAPDQPRPSRDGAAR